MAELLLAIGFEVHGLIRRSSSFNTGRLSHLYKDPHKEDVSLFLHYGDLSDAMRISTLVAELQPDFIFNFAAQSHVRVSFDEPGNALDIDSSGALYLLEAIRQHSPESRFYQASSSEMFGNSPAPQSLESKFAPRSPYAIAKTSAHHFVEMYREAYGIFCQSGILFNHESPRRGQTFVTRKITKAAAEIYGGNQEVLHLGNLEAKRDWGYAPDYVACIWKMMNRDNPEDFLLGTGKTSTVKDFLDYTFSLVGLDPEQHVRYDERYIRPTEVNHLEANIEDFPVPQDFPKLVELNELARIMLTHDLSDSNIDKPEGELWNSVIQ